MANTIYPFRVTDNNGALVPGATITIGAVTLAADTPANVPAARGLAGATLNGSTGISVSYHDFGNGDYSLTYDPESFGEAYVPIVPGKAGSTITGANSLIGVICTKDSSRVQTALPNAALPTDSSIQTDAAAAISSAGLATAAALASVASHAANADSQSASAVTSLTLLQGLVGHNQGVRNQQYDSDGNLTSADICAYDTGAHATLNDGASGLAHKWTLTLTYTAGQQTSQAISTVS